MAQLTQSWKAANRYATGSTRVSLTIPSGRFFDATTIDAELRRADDNGRIVIDFSAPPNDQFVRRPQRGLVIGVTAHEDQPRFFLVDTRQARRRLARASADANLIMPAAYVLDDITVGVISAVASMDDALLSDDAMLARCREQLNGYETLTRSAVGRDIVSDLASVTPRQRQLHQRPHRPINTQHRVRQLEERVRPRGEAPVQLTAEPRQPTSRIHSLRAGPARPRLDRLRQPRHTERHGHRPLSPRSFA